MPNVDSHEIEGETPSNSQPAPSISISLSITPEGYEVNGEPVTDLTAMLKTIVAIVKQHPMVEDAQAQLEAGYSE